MNSHRNSCDGVEDLLQVSSLLYSLALQQIEVNLLAPELFFFNFSTSVYKM